ncbi:hypothetical protein [Aureispira anguillae]|uniref:Uncharacterized protein n=1 Tax=Aureispira anguillae TaxID=2864201 RepID=A0A916DWY8_9BACT|nr:hypothetical protein [Aureispira anguillae]BDS15327.1 hypothetical protein AsAng_0061110 [Aureispira anguillae]
MNLKLLIFITLLAGSIFCQAQKRKKIKLEEEKIALQFFLDSIYPFRPLIKDKQLVSEGKIEQAAYYHFIYVIPNYKEIRKLYQKDEDSGIYRSPIKSRPKEYQGGVKGRFHPCKYGIKKRTYNYFSNKRDSIMARLDISSMYYDSTKQESLVNINITRTNLRKSHQWYIYFSYGIVIKNKKVKYWAIQENY